MSEQLRAREVERPTDKGVTAINEAIVRANGSNPDQKSILVARTFITRPEVGALNEPNGDIYLGAMSITAALGNEIPIVFPVPQSDLDHLKSIGLWNPNKQILLEVNPRVNENGQFTRLGYPDTNTIVLLGDLPEDQIAQFRGDYLTTTLSTADARENAQNLGFEFVQTSEAKKTNNKALLREQKEKYGIRMFEGIVLDENSQIDDVVTQVLSSKEGGWMKLDKGSGGDMVIRIKSQTENIDDLSEEQQNELVNCFGEERARKIIQNRVMNSIEQFRDSVKQAFDHTDRPADFDQYWPEDQILPNSDKGKILFESDARNLGIIRDNGSNMIVVNNDGTYYVGGRFSQRTGPNGDFRGSELYKPSEIMKKKWQEQEAAVVQFAIDHEMFGVIGIDMPEVVAINNETVAAAMRNEGFQIPNDLEVNGYRTENGSVVVQTNEGDITLRTKSFYGEICDQHTNTYVIEMNGRPPISATAMTIADKYLQHVEDLGVDVSEKHWVQLNIWAKSGSINNMAELVEQLKKTGKDLAGENARSGNLDDGVVIPQALRAIHYRDQNGELQRISGEDGTPQDYNGAKIVLLGRTPDQIEMLLKEIEEAGFSYESVPVSK